MNKTRYMFLVPSYKASFLEEALESIKNQTYTDFKVLVSDDCSPENLKPIYDKVCGNDTRFAFRRNEENMGGKSLVSHWNLLVDLCDTEYLIMASDDDVYEPKFLEEIDMLVEKYPKVDILRAKARRTENGRLAREDFNLDEYMTFAQFACTFGELPIVRCLANYVFRTSRLKEQGYFPDFPAAAKSDSATAMLMAQNGIASTPDVLFTFRISNENLSSVSGYAKNILNVATADLMFVDWYAEKMKPLLDKLPADQAHLRPWVDKAHKSHVEGILHFLMPQMKLCDLLNFFKTFKQRGYLLGTIDNMVIWKNWIKKHRIVSCR